MTSRTSRSALVTCCSSASRPAPTISPCSQSTRVLAATRRRPALWACVVAAFNHTWRLA